METTDSVLAIIVNYNSGERLSDCLASLQDQDVSTHVVVVDNGSYDNSEKKAVCLFPDIELVYFPDNPGYGGAVNRVVQGRDFRHLLVLNPDVVLGPGSLKEMVKLLRYFPGIVGPIVDIEANDSVDRGMTVNHMGMPVGIQPGGFPLFVTGCAFLIDRECFEQVGGFDERYFLFVEDTEICWRSLLAGFDISVSSSSSVFHAGGSVLKGGYLSEKQRYTTSLQRVSLRERNTFAMMISCAPWYWLVIILPLLVLRISFLATAAAILCKRRLANALWSGLAWNVRQLPRSWDRRRSIQTTTRKRREIAERIRFDSPILRALAHGLPQIN